MSASPDRLLLLAGATVYLAVAWVLLRWIIRHRRYYGVPYTPRAILIALITGVGIGGGFAMIGGLILNQSTDGLQLSLFQTFIPGPETGMVYLSAILFCITHTALSAGIHWFLLNSETEDLDYIRFLLPIIALLSYVILTYEFAIEAIPAISRLSFVPILIMAFMFSNQSRSIHWSSRPYFRVVFLISVVLSLPLIPLLHLPLFIGATTSGVLLYTVLKLTTLFILVSVVITTLFVRTTPEIKRQFTYTNYRNRIEDSYLIAGFIVLIAIIEFIGHHTLRNWVFNGGPDAGAIAVTYSTLFLFLIYGFYTTAVIVLSKQLHQPITRFREALNKTSTGNLNALMPVTRKDDIGELADSYNMMVFRLKNLQDELAESEREAAWNEMARQVAHEIKNPLTPMKLSIQHLYQQVEYHQRPIEEVRPMVKRIAHTLIEEIDSLSTIASDFSKFARPITDEFESIELNDLLRTVLELYSHDNRTSICTDLSDESLPIHAAQDELKRVFINLIKNAMEASGTGGLLYLRTFRHQTSAVIELADNGKGMDENVRKKVFVPNFSTKNSGTGLGLAISKKIIEAHKGTIRFATVTGLGTTFTVYLPLFPSTTTTYESSASETAPNRPLQG